MVNKVTGDVFYAINISGELKPSLLIQIKLKDQLFIKEYLDCMLEKGWIHLSCLPLRALMFVVPKEESKRPVVNY